MKKVWVFTCSLLWYTSSLFAQNIDSATQARINNYYKLALQYKDGKDVPMDYTIAFEYFNKAAELGDPQSLYAVAYMYYKGLGCQQNYDSAASLFAKGAVLGKDNSLYFYGLCWRNGYGRTKNDDSAKYYLTKSADLGYRQAMMELQSLTAENSNDSAAHVLLGQIHNAAIPDKKVLNHYNKIQPHLPSSEIIAGNYTGWLIQYDWSGEHIVSIKKLQLNVTSDHNKIDGQWIENGTDTANINASIEADSLVFYKTKYNRKDHYSPDNAVQYKFTDAKLTLAQVGDSIFLAGNIEMFSPARGEPSKPLFAALSRKGLNTMDSLFFSKLGLNAYPNPFTNVVTIQFNLIKSSPVQVELLDIDGTLLYQNFAGILEPGVYALPISNLNIASGVYLLKMRYGNQSRTVKVMKQL